jgi:hypothetical protein
VDLCRALCIPTSEVRATKAGKPRRFPITTDNLRVAIIDKTTGHDQRFTVASIFDLDATLGFAAGTFLGELGPLLKTAQHMQRVARELRFLAVREYTAASKDTKAQRLEAADNLTGCIAEARRYVQAANELLDLHTENRKAAPLQLALTASTYKSLLCTYGH